MTVKTKSSLKVQIFHTVCKNPLNDSGATHPLRNAACEPYCPFAAGNSLALRRELVSLLLSSKGSSFPAHFNEAINHVRAALFLSRCVWVVPTTIGP